MEGWVEKGWVKLHMDFQCKARDYSRHRVVTSLSLVIAFTLVAVPTSTVMSLLLFLCLYLPVMVKKGLRQVRGAADGSSVCCDALTLHSVMLWPQAYLLE